MRRTPKGYRCLAQDEARSIQAILIGRKDDPNWLFQQCCRIAKALSERNVALAQIYGIGIPVVELDSQQFMKVASAAQFVKADFNPDQPRDALGRWTDESGTAPVVPLAGRPGMSAQSNDVVTSPRNTDPATGRL